MMEEDIIWLVLHLETNQIEPMVNSGYRRLTFNYNRSELLKLVSIKGTI